MTEEHFRALYANTPFEFFLYDSSDLRGGPMCLDRMFHFLSGASR